ncbi:MAG: efflux RND transporter periplasmic adaptor subunit [Bacillota bacterium]|nr:efflux RND transporter periplasmic adaptor subunit [Bacillota bacterium]
MKSKVIKAIIACVVAVGIGIGGYVAYSAYFTKQPVKAATQYYNTSAKKMNLQVTIQGTGAAYAANTKDVAANNKGTLEGLSLKVGDKVTAGQTLFTAKSSDLSKNVTTAENNLTKQKLALTSDESAAKVDDNKVAQDKISVSDAQAQVDDAYTQLNNMTVTAPIGGVITTVNNSNGDSVDSSKSVLSIVDMNSIKVKVSVDELDIAKVAIGQKATIKFDAIKNKTYEGSVETIAETGTTSNNVTTYDVVVSVKDPTGIKLGMNANVTIAVESKDNALVIPAEALIERNGQKYVRVEDSSSTNNTSNSNNQTNSQSNNNNQSSTSAQQGKTSYGMRNGASISTGTNSKLVAIKTGMETQNYIEVTEGVTEGQKVLVQLPQVSSSTSSNNKSSFGGGFGGGDMGGFGGGQMGGGQGFQGGGSNRSSGSSGGSKN